MSAFDENLNIADGRSTSMNSVFWQPQLRKDLGGQVPSEEPEVLATRPSTINPLDHISLCGADQAPPALASSL